MPSVRPVPSHMPLLSAKNRFVAPSLYHRYILRPLSIVFLYGRAACSAAYPGAQFLNISRSLSSPNFTSDGTKEEGWSNL